MDRSTKLSIPTCRRILIQALAAATISSFVAACVVRSGYEPCDGKSPGDSCRLCAHSDPECVETQQVKTCSASGVCSGRSSVDAGANVDVDQPNDGHSWLVDSGGGFCLSWTGVEDGPDGTLWLGAGGGLFRVDAANPGFTFAIDRRAIEAGPVTALRRIGKDLFVVFGSEVVRYRGRTDRASFGVGTSTPVAVSDNGCLALRHKDELMVRLPGETDFRSAALPRPTNGFRLEVDAAVGLPDSILVRTYRTGDGAIGGLYRLTCPGLEVTEIARGKAVVNLSRFARDGANRILAIDRLNAGVASSHRLVQSEDEGKTWDAVTVPDGWQSSVFAARGKWLVVAPPNLGAILLSSDAGQHWVMDPIDTYRSVARYETMSVHVSDSGVVTATANCNFLIHRRLPLAE